MQIGASSQLCAGKRVVTVGRLRGGGGSEWGLDGVTEWVGAVTVVKGREGEQQWDDCGEAREGTSGGTIFFPPESPKRLTTEVRGPV